MKIGKYHKTDLHIHTWNSFDFKILDKRLKSELTHGQKLQEISKLAEKLKKNNVDIIAITDHNKFNAADFELIKRELEKSSIIVFPGVEVNMFEHGFNDENFQHSLVIVPQETDLVKFENFVNSREKEINGFIKNKNKITPMFNFNDFLYKLSAMINEEDLIVITHDLGKHRARTEIHDDAKSEYSDYPLKVGLVTAVEIGHNNQITDKLKDLGIPAVKFSDIHDYDKYDFFASNLPYFKFIPTYEGLKMVFSDHESRIYSQEEYNISQNKNKNLNYIESIKFVDKEIELSPNLNVLIGQRSTGKSMMGHFLAKKFTGTGNKEKEKEYSKHLETSKIEYKVNGEWRKEDTRSSIVRYIHQEEVIKFVDKATTEENWEDIFKLFDQRSVVLPKVNHIKFNAYLEDIKSFFEYRVTKDGKDSTIKEIILKISEITTSQDKNKAMESISDISKHHPYEVDEVQLSDLNKLRNGISTVIGDYKIISRSDMSNIVNREELDRIIMNLKEINETQLFAEQMRSHKYTEIQNRLEEFINYEFDKINFSSNRSEIEAINSYNRMVTESFDKVSRYLSDVEYYSRKPRRRISLLSDSDKKIYLEPIPSSVLDIQLINEELEKEYNSILEYIMEESIELAKAGYSKNNRKYNDVEKRLDKISSRITGKKIALFIEENGEKINVSERSQGYIAATILEALLKGSNSRERIQILIIDQPEDQIDNKTINDFLLDTIRNLKKEIQIFMITHSAQLVVNSDAENIIVFSEKNGKYKRFYGSIEYQEKYNIKKMILDNLEGGFEAFNNRRKKYGKK